MFVSLPGKWPLVLPFCYGYSIGGVQEALCCAVLSAAQESLELRKVADFFFSFGTKFKLKVLHEHARASACCMLPNVGVLGVVHLVCVRVVDAGARLLRLVTSFSWPMTRGCCINYIIKCQNKSLWGGGYNFLLVLAKRVKLN